jgi:hypothetical protein
MKNHDIKHPKFNNIIMQHTQNTLVFHQNPGHQVMLRSINKQRLFFHQSTAR